MRLAHCIFLFAALAGARTAHASWGTTSWGEAPHAVALSATSAGEKVASEDCPISWEIRNPQELVVTTSTERGVSMFHRYQFAKGIGLVKATTFVGTTGGSSSSTQELCEARKQDLTAKYGAPTQSNGTTGFDFMWTKPDASEVVRLAHEKGMCAQIAASRAYASIQDKKPGVDCFKPIKLDDVNRDELDGSAHTTCTATTKQFFAARPLRIEKAADLQFELDIDKPGQIRISDANNKELAATKTTPQSSDHLALARVAVEPGCYLVELATEGEKVASKYRLRIEPYADWKENDDLRREEELGEPGDAGPPTARFPAIIMGTPPYQGSRVHLYQTGTIALAEGGNMYGTSTNLGVELTKHPRVRAIVGGTLSIMVQPTDDQFGTSNTMFPIGLWGGARANATKRLFVTARAGLLGYYITADADEMILGGIDRSESGGGYLFGLDLTFSTLNAGIEWWFLGDTVTTFHIGFGF